MKHRFGAAVAATVGVVLLFGSPHGALAQSRSEAKIKANEKVVTDFEREVLQAHHVDLASKYYAPDIIQHNPNVPSGLAGFQQFFSRIWKEPLPIKPVMDPAPAVIMGDGDLVLIMTKSARPDPTAPGQTYDAYWFDLFRVKNGKIVEHWDGATKNPPRP